MYADPLEVREPTESQRENIKSVRAGCVALMDILSVLPDNRRRSVAVTKLEEVFMWAEKGIIFSE